MSFITVTREHEFCAGHRVVGHEGKCRFLHGHNYVVSFICMANDEVNPTDTVGRVIDFSVLKEKLCMWLENNWDHKFLAWEHYPVLRHLVTHAWETTRGSKDDECIETFENSIIFVPFNPTAENMAKYLVKVVGPEQLEGTGVRLSTVNIQETSKCGATYYTGD
jgi:6-pyruvoyltetrahydropterin/6-carboxytetrahydropterin synthase